MESIEKVKEYLCQRISAIRIAEMQYSAYGNQTLSNHMCAEADELQKVLDMLR